MRDGNLLEPFGAIAVAGALEKAGVTRADPSIRELPLPIPSVFAGEGENGAGDVAINLHCRFSLSAPLWRGPHPRSRTAHATGVARLAMGLDQIVRERRPCLSSGTTRLCTRSPLPRNNNSHAPSLFLKQLEFQLFSSVRGKLADVALIVRSGAGAIGGRERRSRPARGEKLGGPHCDSFAHIGAWVGYAEHLPTCRVKPDTLC